MPDFSLQVLVPDMRFEVTNEAEVVGKMAGAISGKSKARLRSGKGSKGRLPSPKDGGRALNRSGRLANDIQASPSRKDPTKWIVHAPGKRPAKEVGAKAGAARHRQRVARQAKVDAFLKASPVEAFDLSKRDLRRRLKLSKIRIRAVRTNNALLAVLANAPKDVRAKNGDRGLYRVLERTPLYDRVAARAAVKTIKYRLTAANGS